MEKVPNCIILHVLKIYCNIKMFSGAPRRLKFLKICILPQILIFLSLLRFFTHIKHLYIIKIICQYLNYILFYIFTYTALGSSLQKDYPELTTWRWLCRAPPMPFPTTRPLAWYCISSHCYFRFGNWLYFQKTVF